MSGTENSGFERGDVVAVALPPGPAWVDVVREVWDAGAVLFPVDVRLPDPSIRTLLEHARPTVLLEASGQTRRRDGEPAPDLAAIVHTSGTAGEPKLVAFERPALAAAVDLSAEALAADPRAGWLCCLPPAHVGGLLVLLRAVLLGAPVAVHERFDPQRFGAAADVAYTSIVPTMLRRLLDERIALERYRAILVGGAALSPELRERAREAGARIVETYGLTESAGGVVYDGRPFPGTQLRIHGGGIELVGPTLMRGYHLDPRATEDAFTPDGWLRTGDAGAIDAEGRLRVTGRTDELILTGGEKVWPQEVEEALGSHPGILEVAVAGHPDAEWGTRVVAHVVPSDPREPPTLEELRDHAARRLPRYAAPRELRVVEALPRTANGKLRRAALTDLGSGAQE